MANAGIRERQLGNGLWYRVLDGLPRAILGHIDINVNSSDFDFLITSSYLRSTRTHAPETLPIISTTTTHQKYLNRTLLQYFFFFFEEWFLHLRKYLFCIWRLMAALVSAVLVARLCEMLLMKCLDGLSCQAQKNSLSSMHRYTLKVEWYNPLLSRWLRAFIGVSRNWVIGTPTMQIYAPMLKAERKVNTLPNE